MSMKSKYPMSYMIPLLLKSGHTSVKTLKGAVNGLARLSNCKGEVRRRENSILCFSNPKVLINLLVLRVVKLFRTVDSVA